MTFNTNMPPIPQRKRTAKDEFYPSENRSMLNSAIEMIKRGKNEPRILETLMGCWMIGSKTAFSILQQAKQYVDSQEAEVRQAQQTLTKEEVEELERERGMAGPAAPTKPAPAKPMPGTPAPTTPAPNPFRPPKPGIEIRPKARMM